MIKCIRGGSYIFYSLINNVLGELLLVSDGKLLTGVYFVGQKNFPKIDALWAYSPDLDIFIITKIQLQEYFTGKRSCFDIQYSLVGSVLQKKVWIALSKILIGETISYKNIANIIKEPKAIRAVANAVANNKITIIIPCHRVIGSNGRLLGYAAGIEKQKNLLELEKQYYYK